MKWRDYKALIEYQYAVLRYTFSTKTRHVYNSFNLNEDHFKNPETINQRLETFAKGIINETMERHVFNNRKKEDGEKRRLDRLLSGGFVGDWLSAVLLRALSRPVIGP